LSNAAPQALVRAQAPFAVSVDISSGEDGMPPSPTRTARALARKQEMLASMQSAHTTLAPLNAKNMSQTLALRSTRPW